MPAVDQIQAALPEFGCLQVVAPVDHAGTVEALQNAYAFNQLLDSHIRAVNHDYYSPQQVLQMVDGWAPDIACVAAEFDIPPELLAGTMALEADLDYHWTDAIFDGLVVSPLGGIFSHVEVGAAFAGVHFRHLKPALRQLGRDFSGSTFYQHYYDLIVSTSDADLTVLSTRYRLIDLADAAIMARHYAQLRMGTHRLSEMTITDMAFTWSAYRGGVVNTSADLQDDHRWSLDYLQRAENPQDFGDTLLALPYFRYFRQFYAQNLAFTTVR